MQTRSAFARLAADLALRSASALNEEDDATKEFAVKRSLLSAALVLTVAAALAGCASPPVNRHSAITLTTAPSVDLDRYLGRWYEIARLPNGFERDCEGVTAHYTRKPDGMIRVVNTCRAGAPDGTPRSATGRAKIVDQVSNAKLKVSFFGPFWGDYWILWRADDYSLSLVGEPSGRYLWILSRTPTLDDDVKAQALRRLENLGYDTSKLYFPAQPPAQ